MQSSNNVYNNQTDITIVATIAVIRDTLGYNMIASLPTDPVELAAMVLTLIVVAVIVLSDPVEIAPPAAVPVALAP
jgi:hypothetical protein